MSRTITITFTPCEPTPANGYNIKWRVLGSGDPFTDAGNFTDSPAVFNDPDGTSETQYEGIIVSDCGGGLFGNPIAWATEGDPGSGDGVPIDVRLDTGEGGVCGTTVTLYVSSLDGIIHPGAIVYDDAGLTTPHTGSLFISDPGGVIYNLDDTTGEVGLATGDAC